MSSNRFYLPSTRLEQGKQIELPLETSRQISKVLRMREHDRITLFDGSGMEWPSEIVSMQKDAVSVVPQAPVDPGSEPSLAVTVYQALVAADRMEFVIRKSTELGAARIVPVITERVQARDQKISENRLSRWMRIAVEAAEQSGRTRVPEILLPELLKESLARSVPEGPVIILWEEEREQSLKHAVQQSLRGKPDHVSVLIGPVGGLSGAEADACRSAGAMLASVGTRILRAETAPVVALTVLMYEAGDLGGQDSKPSQ